MGLDISKILNQWPYNPINESRNYRKTTADDGRLLIQIRIPMGIQQIEYEGRPDEEHPHGYESYLEYFMDQSKQDTQFALTSEDIQNLMHEGLLYYQRYLALYEMEDWKGVIRDSARNIRYFDFVKQYAIHDENKMSTEQYRPYILRMNSVAQMQVLRSQEKIDEAIALLKKTVDEINDLEKVHTQIWELEKQKSLLFLHDLIKKLEEEKPESLMEILKREKEEAVAGQDFERAAELRDRIKDLEEKHHQNRKEQ